MQPYIYTLRGLAILSGITTASLVALPSLQQYSTIGHALITYIAQLFLFLSALALCFSYEKRVWEENHHQKYYIRRLTAIMLPIMVVSGILYSLNIISVWNTAAYYPTFVFPIIALLALYALFPFMIKLFIAASKVKYLIYSIPFTITAICIAIHHYTTVLIAPELLGLLPLISWSFISYYLHTTRGFRHWTFTDCAFVALGIALLLAFIPALPESVQPYIKSLLIGSLILLMIELVKRSIIDSSYTLVWLGKYSLSCYLAALLLLPWLPTQLDYVLAHVIHNTVLCLVLSVCGSIIVHFYAMKALYRWIEQPAINLGHLIISKIDPSDNNTNPPLST